MVAGHLRCVLVSVSGRVIMNGGPRYSLGQAAAGGDSEALMALLENIDSLSQSARRASM